MKTKADLIKELEELSQVIWNVRDNLNNSKRETEDAKRELENEMHNNKQMQDRSDEKSKILQLVVEILAGEASPTSKTEILIDLFPEVKEFKESKKKNIYSGNMGYQHGRF